MEGVRMWVCVAIAVGSAVLGFGVGVMVADSVKLFENMQAIKLAQKRKCSPCQLRREARVRNAITECAPQFSALADRLRKATEDVHEQFRNAAAQPVYSIGTWDTVKQAFTPHMDVPAFNLTRAELVQSIRLIRADGYTVHRYGNTETGHDNNDPAVMIQRTDGMSVDEILETWQR